ncbi:Uma2 family endonuclease [Leptothoe kymatousa]|uniref:Uma2 family endonuclease n=1 Tax=Leptothoe kymatousa TAU-MAC 1615 TaxID=2364775 RepID=A0ABS5XZS9_9CYAN|nr:Uma2 family endonuclease [Leptothoe kymatousa]MBT9311103.1 Uma2 family endonuclease [Leptothoe kymatousa TAU-MAC 1615]
MVYVPAALRYRRHGKPHGAIMGWLAAYGAFTPGVEVADNTTVRLDLDNEPQPDALPHINADCGGQSRISDDDYVEGAPELIVEIAASSAAYDLYEKKTVYRRNGVREYVIWQVTENEISWFSLENGDYQPLLPDGQGIIQSKVFPGLDLPILALLKGDLATVLTQVQRNIGTERHQRFIDQLC